MNRQPSLRRRLLLAGGVGLLLVSLLASALLGELFKRSARDRLDHELQQDMLTLLSQAEVDPDGQLRLRQEPNDARFERVFSGAYWQIAGTDGRVLLQSRSLWDETLPAKAAGPATRNLPGPLQQFLRARVQQVRLPRASEPFVAVVATDRSALDADVAAFRKRTAIALGMLVAAWLAVLASQVHFGLRPLHRLGAQLERVRRGDAQRIDTQGLGAEVAPLGEELNALLDHQQRMVARARTSAQDLAHALKTPLSVLATEADSDGTHWRATVREQSARMQASVDRYLAAGLAADHRQRTDVAAVAQAMCRLMARVHGERGIAFTAAGIDPALQFAGASADLEEMLGNLLDNAGRWAQQQVTVEAETSEGQLRIEVRDDGPGLAADALERVTQRGVRLDEREGSSGLGLAIVGDIAASYGGRLQLENAQPGLRATLWLPVA
ncbi:HAMP domain-containing histidine kinase [Stenotrophomonas maltophilia]|uniref:histidine kinase n=1 Tax=Stenotrophomonas maltophilia TaxID=40324 RepID=A0AA41CH41_STEMA|nr:MULTISPECIES: HAMP domain-containing sensor histidine kinase [Stenotrophomonas]AWB80308.1 sensor histidine kinase [Stenotrophomonas maltophilia]KOO85819.1 histidine kinase [Stenotrophomonas maltophilia]MBH1583795.1 HAMP domain-containing histidine kinase [Stenotrophomonas maltophilia]MBH1714869.1 HAMP domain-containing histidine kinase [Stenotrophomonas maltophilia]MBH1791245.1 HAMP domain-containing histidine kinase [Stenotrophomonas maltophilia]